MTTIKGQVKEFRSTLEVAVAIIGCIIYLNGWFIDSVTVQVTEQIKVDSITQKQWLMGTTEIKLGQVESDLRAYQRLGLDTLSPQDRHHYEQLIKSEEKLTDTRNRLLGLSQ